MTSQLVCRACRDDASVARVNKVFRQLSLCRQCVAHLIGPKYNRETFDTDVDVADTGGTSKAARTDADDDDDLFTATDVFFLPERGGYVAFDIAPNTHGYIERVPQSHYPEIEDAAAEWYAEARLPPVYGAGTKEEEEEEGGGGGDTDYMVHTTQTMFNAIDAALGAVRRVGLLERLSFLWLNVAHSEDEFFLGFDAQYTIAEDRALKQLLASKQITRVYTQSMIVPRWTTYRLNRATSDQGFVREAERYVLRHLQAMLPASERIAMTWEADRGQYYISALPQDYRHDFMGTNETESAVSLYTLARSEHLRALVRGMTARRLWDRTLLAHRGQGVSFDTGKLAPDPIVFDGAMPLMIHQRPSRDETWQAFLSAEFSDDTRLRLQARIEALYAEQVPHAPLSLYARPVFAPNVGTLLWHGTKSVELASDNTQTLKLESFFSTDMRFSIPYAHSGMLLHRLVRPLPDKTVYIGLLSAIGVARTQTLLPISNTKTVFESIWARMFGYQPLFFLHAARLVCKVWNTAMLVYENTGNGSALGDRGLEVMLCEPTEFIGERLEPHLLSGVDVFNNQPLLLSLEHMFIEFAAANAEIVASVRPRYTTTWQNVRDAVWVTDTSSSSSSSSTTTPNGMLYLANMAPNRWRSDVTDTTEVRVYDIETLDKAMRQALLTKTTKSTTTTAADALPAWYLDTHRRTSTQARRAAQAILQAVHNNIASHPGFLLTERSYTWLAHRMFARHAPAIVHVVQYAHLNASAMAAYGWIHSKNTMQ